MTGKQQENGDD